MACKRIREQISILLVLALVCAGSSLQDEQDEQLEYESSWGFGQLMENAAFRKELSISEAQASSFQASRQAIWEQLVEEGRRHDELGGDAKLPVADMYVRETNQMFLEMLNEKDATRAKQLHVWALINEKGSLHVCTRFWPISKAIVWESELQEREFIKEADRLNKEFQNELQELRVSYRIKCMEALPVKAKETLQQQLGPSNWLGSAESRF